MLNFNIFGGILFSFVGCDSLSGAWVLASYNLVTLGSLSTSSDVDNVTLVCGSLVSGSSATFAGHISQTASTASIYSLEVNGQIASGNSIQVNAGSFGVGTNPSHNITRNNNVGFTVDGRTFNMNGGNQGATVKVDSNLAAKCSAIQSAVQTLSNYLATLPTTAGNTVSIPTTQSGPLNFYVNAVDYNGVSVFNLNGNTVLNNGQVQQIQLFVASSVSSTLQLVVINLSGSNIGFSQANFVGGWFTSLASRAQTIWNFPQATSLTINRDWMGALLAPYAAVTASSDIEGPAVVLSLTTTAELHNPPLTLPVCNSPTTTTTTTPSVQCSTPSTGANYFSSYNLITLGDLSTSSDVDNRTIVCGSLVSGSSANFAGHIPQTASTATIYSLEVNGQIASGSTINVDAGSFGVGTNPSHTIIRNGNVGFTVDGRAVNINSGNDGGTLNVDTNLASTCAAITTGIQTLSTILSQLPTTLGNTVSIPTTQSGPLNFYVNAVDSNGVSVFNLDGNTVLNNPLVQQIEIFVGSSVSSTLQLVVINLSGTSISFSYGNFVGDWLNSISTGRAQTIWNLPQATSLYIGSDWMGALLAPYAAVTTAIDIDGATAVLSLTTTAEVHNPPIIIPACL